MTGSNRTRGRASRRLEPLTSDEAEQRLGEAGAHYAAGRLSEASAAYEAVEARNPDDVRAPYSLAVIDIRQGRLVQARERLQRVVRREPGLFTAQHNLGYVSQTLGLGARRLRPMRLRWRCARRLPTPPSTLPRLWRSSGGRMKPSTATGS